MLKEDVKREFPEEFEMWMNRPQNLVIPGGESINDLQRRSFTRLKEILSDKSGPNNFAVVSHRSVLKCLLGAILGMDEDYFWKIHLNTAALNMVEYIPNCRFILKKLNG